jgi:diaminopimelate epimerase
MAAGPRRTLRFCKMHGAGNDFVVLDLRDGTPPPDAALSRALGDRHRGVGCDQILTIEPPRSDGAVASYRIWNSDGGNAAQCGNGARCVAAWLVRDGSARGERFVLDSPSGRHAVERLGDDAYRVAMGVPRFDPASIPLRGFAHAQDAYVLDLDGREVRFGAVSMGNPHALLVVDDIARAPVAKLGPALQASAAFPDSVNVGFAAVVGRDAIRLHVFERGAGETLACGSGACAAVVAGIERGLLDSPVTVETRGGRLTIAWAGGDNPVWMKGPAISVFEGTIEL